MTQPDHPSVPSSATRRLLLLLSSRTVMAGATIAPSPPAMAEHFVDVPAAGLLARLVLNLPALLIAVAAYPSDWVIDRAGCNAPLLIGVLPASAAASSCPTTAPGRWPRARRRRAAEPWAADRHDFPRPVPVAAAGAADHRRIRPADAVHRRRQAGFGPRRPLHARAPARGAADRASTPPDHGAIPA